MSMRVVKVGTPHCVDISALAPRLQTMITLLLTHQDHICHYSTGTLILQFKEKDVTAKLTNNLPLER